MRLSLKNKGYLYLNKEDDVKNENKELKEKPELNDLLSSVVGKDNISSVWSNFWGAIDSNGWYSRSSDYIDIVNYTIKGCWNVPHISGNILINKEYIQKIQGFFTNNSGNNCFSYDMWFSDNCRKNNISMYVTNIEKYGYIIDYDDQSI